MVGEAFVRLRPDDTGFQQEATTQVRRDVDRVERSLRSGTQGVDRFGRGVLAGSGALGQLSRAAAFTSTAFLGGAGLIYGLKVSSEAASNLSEQISKARVVFGSSASTIEEWSKTSATAMGLARDQAIETAAGFGALLRPLGFTQVAAAATSEQLTGLGADLASFSNTPVPDALEAIRSGLVGEVEPLRRYGVVLSEAAVQHRALAETGKSVASQLTAQEKVAARLSLIFQQTRLAQGDFARTSGGLANQQRIFAANLRDVEAAIGAGLNPALNELLPKLNAFLGDSKNQEALTRKVTAAVEGSVQVIEDLAAALQTVLDVTGPVIEALGGLEHVAETALILGLLVKAKRAAAGFGLIRTESVLARTQIVADSAVEQAALGRTAAAAETSATRIGAARGRLLKGAGLIGAALVLPDIVGSGGSADDATTAAITGFIAKSLTGSTPIAAATITHRVDNDRLLAAVLKLRPDLAAKFAAPTAAAEFVQSNFLDTLRGGPKPAGLGGSATAGSLTQGQTLSAALQRALAVSRTAGTGSSAELSALHDQAAADQRAIDFAEKAIKDRRGNTVAFAKDLERLYADLGSTNSQIQSIVEQGEARVAASQQAADDARQRAADARAKAAAAHEQLVQSAVQTVDTFLQQLRERAAADDDLADALAAADAEKEAARVARLEALTKIPEQLQLQLQIAEDRAKKETQLLPTLNRTHRVLERQLSTLKRMGGTKLEILRASAELASVDRRIRDIQHPAVTRAGTGGAGGTGFTLAELFAQAAAEIGVASNIGGPGAVLSAQDARRAFANATLNHRDGDKTIVINQVINGATTTPLTALEAATRAARALR